MGRRVKLLLENWREYLDEGMKTPADLPDHVYIGIKQVIVTAHGLSQEQRQIVDGALFYTTLQWNGQQ